MPPYFDLRRSTAHRVACIALYRALLSQCSRIYIPDERWRGPVNPIKHLIRKRFYKQKHQQSQRLVVHALKLGYQTEELLRTAGDGDEGAIRKIMSVIREHQERGDASRDLQAQKPAQPKIPPRPRPEPYPGAKKMFETRPRPLSELSGRRKVPKFQDTSGGIPLLVFKKPQSEFLSRIIKDRIKRHTKLNYTIEDFEFDHQYAVYEDQWENLVETKSRGGPWTGARDAWKRDMRDELHQMKLHNVNLAGKMIKLMDQEQALAEQEREDRKTERFKRWRETQAGQESKTIYRVIATEKTE